MKFEKFSFLDSSGKKINFSCDRKKLANLFGSNPGAPSFLTEIFFKKEVLDKYYGSPSAYSIVDGGLWCGTKWMLRIDNSHPDFIVVYLGDLDEIPSEEQKHWKLYNIVTKNNGSGTAFKRNFLAEACSPEDPVLFFKEKFKSFNNKWNNKYGWNLFKLLNKEDEHHWKTLRLPKEEQKEFDELVLSLTKILIDSLNVNEMKKNLSYNMNESDKSISLFNRYLEQKHKFRSPEAIQYLKDLQELRSRGSAHRKSKTFKKNYGKFDKGSLTDTFKQIIIGAITLLNTLESNSLK